MTRRRVFQIAPSAAGQPDQRLETTLHNTANGIPGIVADLCQHDSRLLLLLLHGSAQSGTVPCQKRIAQETALTWDHAIAHNELQDLRQQPLGVVLRIRHEQLQQHRAPNSAPLCRRTLNASRTKCSESSSAIHFRSRAALHGGTCFAMAASEMTTNFFGPKDSRKILPYVKNSLYSGTKTGWPTICRTSPAAKKAHRI